MHIRKSRPEDLPAMLSLYEHARRIMRESGNLNQWRNGYPREELLRQDIQRGISYVMTGGDGQLHGTFVFFIGDEPAYHVIEDGAWLNEEPYGVIHRIAAGGTARGVLREAVAYGRSQCPNLRIDTHQDNTIMQHLLEKLGFLRCGIIHIQDGTPRIAYQSPAER